MKISIMAPSLAPHPTREIGVNVKRYAGEKIIRKTLRYYFHQDVYVCHPGNCI
jgi:hypothetical protein